MTSSAPPRIATWMLLHLAPRDRDEALTGDLLESLRAGRSRAWYWRQVLVAIAIRWVGTLFSHWPAVVFAAAWAMIAPAWGLFVLRVHHRLDFEGPIWRLPWPWSTVCAIALSTLEWLLFVWSGVLLCRLLLLAVPGAQSQSRIGRAVTLSIAGWVLACSCVLAITLIAAPHSTGRGVDWRTLTFSNVVTNVGALAILQRLPVLIATACGLWGAVPSKQHPMKLAE